MLVREASLCASNREAAAIALNILKVQEDEDGTAAAIRLALVFRATIADPVRPHISEAVYFGNTYPTNS